jgi:hypothetical protein
MVACTFSGVTVHSYRIESISAKGAFTFEVTLNCRTGTFSDITSLQALQGHIGVTTLLSGKTKIQTTGGTKATLVLNGVTYLNCYIADLTHREIPNALPFDRWEYTVKFTQETV